MGHKASDQRALATRLAIAELRKAWLNEHGDEPTQQQQAEWFGVKQQTISAFNRTATVGQKLADGVAEHLGTTVDGLIKLYVKEWQSVRVGDIPGWRDAVEQARRDAGPPGDTFAWAAAEDVVLPLAPRRATASFAYDIAHLLSKHAHGSGTIRRVPGVGTSKK